MSTHITDITLDNAQQLLIEESFNRLVVVDFWASWCEPCKNLMPILEKLANEYAGQFLLAKVDADEMQMIASQFGVRSLPTVMFIKDGQPIDGFAGLQPENHVRELLDKHLPKPWDIKYQEGKALMESGDTDAAFSVLTEAYKASNHQANIGFALAEVLIKMKRFGEAEKVLSDVKMVDQDATYAQLKAELQLAQEAQKTPELQALENAHKQSPEDDEIAFQLAVQYSQNDYTREALVLLYSLICRDMNFRDGEAKKIYLDILAVLGKGDPLAAEFQRKLYTLLY